jgi:NAD(P)H-dependent FMN reductase
MKRSRPSGPVTNPSLFCDSDAHKWAPERITKKLRRDVQSATGVVLATPEYHGCFASELKPIALLGVASGPIGAIKSLEQLRCISSHVGRIVLPGPVSVANVSKVFDAEGNCLDEGVEKQIRGLARSLMDYVGQNICPRIALEAMVREQVEARLLWASRAFAGGSTSPARGRAPSSRP